MSFERYNYFGLDFSRLIANLGTFSVEAIQETSAEADMWYCQEGLNVVRYLRRRDVVEYLLTDPEYRAVFFNKKCQSIKPGKFLTKCDIYTYERAHILAGKLEPPEIIEVEGEAIKWLYRETMHSSQNTATLGSSCMRYRYMSDWFQLYAENTKMVVILDQDKVQARAILWDNVSDGTKTIKLLDRIYGTEKSVAQLKDYAERKGYYSKVYQSYSRHGITLGGEKVHLRNFSVHLKKPLPFTSPLPYLDSFPFGEYKDRELTVLKNEATQSKQHSIRFTNGGRGNPTCLHCGGIVNLMTYKCFDCGEIYDKDRGLRTKCPDCDKAYVAYSYKQPHLNCVVKLKYKCTTCNITHIANSKAEFEAKTCEEEKWITDGGTETKTTPETESEES